MPENHFSFARIFRLLASRLVNNGGGMTDKAEVKEFMLADISFRDYLAAEAMNAMISTIPLPWSLREQCEGDFYNTAQSAYKMADAMLKARG